MNRISSTCQPGISRDPERSPKRLDELAPPPLCEPEAAPGHFKSNGSQPHHAHAGETSTSISTGMEGVKKSSVWDWDAAKPHSQDSPSAKPHINQNMSSNNHGCTCNPQAPVIAPSDLPMNETTSAPSPRMGDHLLTSPFVGHGPRVWRPPWERVLRDMQCRIHLGEQFCSHMRDCRSGMIGYQYHPSRDIVTKNRHTFHDLLNLYTLIRLYDHEMRCRPMDDIPEPKWSTHGAIWKMIERGVWYFWEMITPVPIKHEHDEVEDEGFLFYSETEIGKGTHHLHRMSEPITHPFGCSPPLYLCPRRLTRSSHIGHSGMYILVLCLWHCLHRDHDIDEDPSNKTQRMDAIQGLVQGIVKLQRHGGAYKVYFDRFHHTDEGMETYSGVAMYALAMAQELWEEEMKRNPQPTQKSEDEERKQQITTNDDKQNEYKLKLHECHPTVIPFPIPIAVPVPIPVPIIVRTSKPIDYSISLPNPDDVDISVGTFSPETLSKIQAHLMNDDSNIWGKPMNATNEQQEEKQQIQDKDKEKEEEKEQEEGDGDSPTPIKSPSPPAKTTYNLDNNRLPPLRFVDPRPTPPRSFESDEIERHKHELDYHSAHPIHGDPTGYSTRDIWHPCGWESPAVEYELSHLLYECGISPLTWQMSVEKAVLAYISYVQNGYVEEDYRIAYACWHSRACSLLVRCNLQIIKPEVLIAYVWGINDRIINSGWYDGIIDFAESMTSIEVGFGLCGVIEAYMLLPAQSTYDDDDMHKRRARYLQCIARSYAFLALSQRTHNRAVGAYFTPRSIGGLVQALQLPLMRIDCTGTMIQAFIRLEKAIEARQDEFDETFVTQLESVITHVTM